MADRPILFSAPMIRALIEGRKTQTRRVLKAPKWSTGAADFEAEDDGVYAVAKATGCLSRLRLMADPGDRLWVREAWRLSRMLDAVAPRDLDRCIIPEWIASDLELYKGRKRAGMHLPRWASRLTLTVTDVRVQRLQDISEADAIAEGIELRGYDTMYGWRAYGDDHERAKRQYADPRDSYRSLWDHIHGSGAWDANPWVVAISFDVSRCNIDAMEAHHG